MPEITITIEEFAAEQLQEIMKESDELRGKGVLRIWVAGGGCSGLQYGMAFDPGDPDEGDVVVEDKGITMAIDPLSAQYLDGVTVEWNPDVLAGGFKINNPNAVNSCGCSNSFSTGDETQKTSGCGGCGHNSE